MRDQTRPTPDDGDRELTVVLREELGYSEEYVVHFEVLGRFMTRVRHRCCRHAAPAHLRVRILSSLSSAIEMSDD